MVKGKTTGARFISLTGLLLAAGVLFPVIFHQFGIAGRIFLPMHIPVFLAGLVMGPLAGLAVGVLSPMLSTVLTGIPPLVMVISMIPELAVYGTVSGLLSNGTRTGVFLGLLGGMVVGRVVWCLTAAFIAPLLGFPGRTLTVMLAALAVGWPGMVAQLIFIPPVVVRVRRAVFSS